MTLSKITFRGVEGYITDRRIKSERRSDLFYYELRHDDEDWSQPCTIEDYVVVNHWGTICFKESIDYLLNEWWSTDRLQTDLTAYEVNDIFLAISAGERIEHKDI